MSVYRLPDTGLVVFPCHCLFVLPNGCWISKKRNPRGLCIIIGVSQEYGGCSIIRHDISVARYNRGEICSDGTTQEA